MKHTIVYKNKDKYASFPLLQKIDNRILIGFFTSPTADHTGVFDWKVMQSFNQGIDFGPCLCDKSHYDWPAVSARERSDRFTTILPNGKQIATGSFGFRTITEYDFCANPLKKITKSNVLFLRSSLDNWKTIEQKSWTIPNADVVVTFPRHLQIDNIILVPVYIVLKDGRNKALVWRSDNYGENWKLWNMFPDEVEANEVAFIQTNNGILAHIRSDKSPYIMESWSEDLGVTWTYPTCIYGHDEYGHNVVGGPVHLFRLNDDRILCTYGYRFGIGFMGVRAIVSDDEGSTWGKQIIIRNDGGYSSNLWKRRFWQKKASLANDCGYPVSIQLEDGSVLTAYYITLKDGITHIATTKWEIK